MPEEFQNDFRGFKLRNVSQWEQFKLLLDRNLLELQRNIFVIPILGILAVFNGFLYTCLFYRIDATVVTYDQTANTTYVANLLGLVFLMIMDQLIETSFGQVMMIPKIYPVFKREVQNNMY